MPKPPKDIKAFKHTSAKRAHIPSAEEAGSEAASPAVKSGPSKVEIPLNPVVHRGQDPELFWLGKYGEQENLSNPATTIDLRSIYRHKEESRAHPAHRDRRGSLRAPLRHHFPPDSNQSPRPEDRRALHLAVRRGDDEGDGGLSRPVPTNKHWQSRRTF